MYYIIIVLYFYILYIKYMVLYKLRVPNIGVPPNHPLFIGSSHIFPGFPAWALLPPSVPPGQRGRGLGGLGKAAVYALLKPQFCFNQ